MLPALAESVPLVEPSEGLKARIMAAAAADLAARGAGRPTAPRSRRGAGAGRRRAWRPPAAAPIAVPDRATGGPPDARRASAASWVLRIAAVVAIVALGGWNLLLRNQLDSAQAYQQPSRPVLDVAATAGIVDRGSDRRRRHGRRARRGQRRRAT